MDFLSELEKLRYQTPRLAIINVGQENAEYCTHADKNKNCYLLFAANFNQDCMYSGIILNSRDCVECNNIEYSELCMECVDCFRCYNCSFSQDLKGCYDSDYCYDCVGCSNCFGCAGLRQKKYYIFNKPVTKEEYKKITSEWKAKGQDKIWSEFEKTKLEVPRKFAHLNKTENCTGDYMENSKNCLECFNVFQSEDCMYLIDCWRSRDCLDSMFSDGSELCYECFSFGLQTYNCNFCSYIRSCADCEYSELLFSCKNCFGCIGLQSKQYYILNKPYSKEDYYKKVAEIKAKMRTDGTYGEMLPSTYKLEDTALFML